MSRPEELLSRLERVEARLTRHAAHAGGMRGLTEADAASGERWEVGQVFAHLAEFGGYWVAEAERVVRTYQGQPISFGRVKTDPQRVGAIERHRGEELATLLGRCRSDIGETRDFIRALSVEAWDARGAHSTRGVMDMGDLLEEFVVGHYEEHCAQLDRLVAAEGATGFH